MVPAHCEVGVNLKDRVREALDIYCSWKSKEGTVISVASGPSMGCADVPNLGLNPQTGQMRGDMLYIKQLSRTT